MRWLSLLVALAGAVANISALLRDRRARQEGREAVIAAGREAVDERARNAAAAAAAARADPDRLRDDGHRRD
jgi:hypothetical protein